MDKPFTNGKGRGYNAQNLLKKNGIDFEHFAFTPKEEILIEYGQAIAEDPKHVPEELFEKLKANLRRKRSWSSQPSIIIFAKGKGSLPDICPRQNSLFDSQSKPQDACAL